MRRRGFSLVELLVVIMIVLIVISLVLPALGGARNVAKRATTNAVMDDFAKAVHQFKQDHDGRNPGIYTPAEMGSSENGDNYGFTSSENVILELAGGIVNSAPSSGNNTFNFGPSNQAHADNVTSRRSVNPDLIGAAVEGQNSYYSPPGKHFVRMTRPDQQFAGSGPTNDADIPDFVDAWGQPFLIWVEDENGPTDIADAEDFAAIDSDQRPARFYWASNAGYLKAPNLGQKGRDQTDSVNGSLLSGGRNDQSIRVTMCAVLGHPSFPNVALEDANLDDVLPSNSRSGMVITSAGTDGIYFGADEKASRSNDAAAQGLKYGRNHLNSQGKRLTEDGKPTSADVARDFDDLLLSVGN